MAEKKEKTDSVKKIVTKTTKKKDSVTKAAATKKPKTVKSTKEVKKAETKGKTTPVAKTKGQKPSKVNKKTAKKETKAVKKTTTKSKIVEQKAKEVVSISPASTPQIKTTPVEVREASVKKETSVNRLWWLLFFSLLLNFFFVFSAQVLNMHPFNQTPYNPIGEFLPGISLAPSVTTPSEEKSVVSDNSISQPPLTTISDLSLSAKITTEGGQEFIYLDEKTWIPYDGQPFHVVILQDSTRNDSAPDLGLEVLKKTIHPAIIPEYLDVNSIEGQKIAESFGVRMTPTFFFGEGFDQLKMQGQLVSAHPNIVPYIKKKGPLSLISYEVFEDNNIVFLPFEKTDDLVDNTDPVLGSGAVQVIEYLSYDDPATTIFDNEYQKTIQELVRSNDITYVIKDRKTSDTAISTVLAHQAANSILGYVDASAYLLYRDLLNKNQEQWKNKEPEEAIEALTSLAGQLNIDIRPIWSADKTEEFVQEIEADAEEAIAYNMREGLFLLINGQKVELTTPEALKERIQQERNEKEEKPEEEEESEEN